MQRINIQEWKHVVNTWPVTNSFIYFFILVINFFLKSSFSFLNSHSSILIKYHHGTSLWVTQKLSYHLSYYLEDNLNDFLHFSLEVMMWLNLCIAFSIKFSSKTLRINGCDPLLHYTDKKYSLFFFVTQGIYSSALVLVFKPAPHCVKSTSPPPQKLICHSQVALLLKLVWSFSRKGLLCPAGFMG